MAINPIERDAKNAEGILRGQLASIDRAVGEVAPVGKRLLSRREKLLRSLAQPASTWTPEQGKFVLQTLLRMRKGGNP
jgi:hypothetical protein